jgi:hypothetical protein
MNLVQGKVVVLAFLTVFAAGCQTQDAEKGTEKTNPVAGVVEKLPVPGQTESKEPGKAAASEPGTSESTTLEGKPEAAGEATSTKTPEGSEEVAEPAPSPYGTIPRDTFNRLAMLVDAPVFWAFDETEPGVVAPGEIVTLVLHRSDVVWVKDGTFTAVFDNLYQSVTDLAKQGIHAPSGLPAEEIERRKLVEEDITQGDPRLVFSDLRELTEAEKTFVRHMFQVGTLIDELHFIQHGVQGLRADLPKDHPPSSAAFRRNWGPKCVAPKTEKNPACTAIPGVTKVYVDPYPKALQDQEGFCELLASRPDADKLLRPFVVIREDDESGQLVPVPYTVQYQDLMTAISRELLAAAEAMKDHNEDPLVRYLTVAAQSFLDNQWEPADEAWAAMNVDNSRWYVRVGPDEVYWEPCSRKAGFHLSFARINRASLEWQNKLKPVQQEMENTLADLIGQPYAARTVTFHLPDFIDIVFNCGDARHPLGGTIGQSLPNWGPVANEGRGRTVVMSNLFTDAASLERRRVLSTSLIHADSMAHFPVDAQAGLLSIILHEAMHNFGPSHEYRVDGKKDTEAFGGPLATVLEELKAQTGALWFPILLHSKGLIDTTLMYQTWMDSVLWAFGHISRGMYSDNGKPKPYSQLAAIQVGFLLEKGAMEFLPEELAPNGTDKGVFRLHMDRFPDAINELMKVAGGIKARGDKGAAEELVKKYVDSDVVPQAIITERLLREPRASLVYSFRLD